MTDNTKQLISILERFKNELWQLQNAVLQLSVETSNRELAALVAAGLSRLARELVPSEFPDLAAILEKLSEKIGSEAVSPQLGNAVFELVEALVALPREGDAPLLAALTPLRPMVLAATASQGTLEDSFEGIDPEDLKMFCAEAAEHIQTAESHLVLLEKLQDPKLVAEIFRAIHSIKGGAQYIGLSATATLAHRMETLLDQFRKGERTVTPPVMSVLLKAVDGLATLIRGAEKMKPVPLNAASLVEMIERAVRGESGALPSPPAPAPAQAPAPDRPAARPVSLVPEAPAPQAQQVPAEELGDLELFASEYRQNMDALRAHAQDLEAAAADEEKKALIARSLHSIKGIAGFVGLSAMERLASALDLLLASAFRHRTEMPLDIRRASSVSLDLLDGIFESFQAGIPAPSNVDDQCRTLTDLRDREEKLASWNAPPPAAPVPAEDDPLAHGLALLAQAIEQDDEILAAEALDSIEESALLQGYDEAAIAAGELKRQFTSLAPEMRRESTRRIRSLLPSREDLLETPQPQSEPEMVPFLEAAAPPASAAEAGSPASGSPASGSPATGISATGLPAAGIPAAIDTTGLSGLDSRILADDFDSELVRIYLETTRERLDALEQHLDAGRIPEARILLRDLTAASGYMGYEPVSRQFEAALALLDGSVLDTDGIRQILGRLSTALNRWDLQLRPAEPDAAPPRPSESETEELNRIFLESARTHLGDLYGNILALPSGADPDRLASIQHHLSCLHSAATNIGRSEISEEVEDLQAAIEAETTGAQKISARSLERLVDSTRRLYATCGLTPPSVKEAAAPPEAEAPFPEISTVPSTLDELFSEPASSGPSVFETAAARPRETVREAPAAAPPAPAPAPASAAAAQTEPLAAPAAEEPVETGRSLVEAQATVRVDTNKIDDLMNMVAELVVNRSSFMALSTNLRDIILRLLESGNLGTVDARDLRGALNRYDEATTDLGRVSNQLQEGVMRIRMMPVKTLFSRVPRLVRDLALREGRSVKVTFTGEETELDKTVIEQLSDPLVHLIRNAISHGIEPPSDRLMSGKPAEGLLKISAQHQGNMVIIDVLDDGRGIDLEAVRRTLAGRGVSSMAEVQRLSQRELLAALFLPGFSTSEKVSDVSGRGVGLDVVKRNIESLGGQIDVSSEQGKGCRFSIRIPLTMAILQALLVKVHDEIYSIPVSAIIQIVKVTPAEISTVEGQEVITVRNRVIPLVRLRDVFDYNYHLVTRQAIVDNGTAATQAAYVVILQGEGREIGVVADSLIGGQDLVIKSLDDELVDAEGVAGAAILGDGTVTLILDVAEIQKMAIDKEHYEEKKLSDTMRIFERYVRENRTAELVTVH